MSKLIYLFFIKSEELVHLELRNTLADVYLSRYKRIILWGSGINPVPAQFDSLYTEMTWVNNTIEAERTEMEHYTDAVVRKKLSVFLQEFRM